MDWISNFYAPECEHIRSDSIGSQCRGTGAADLVVEFGTAGGELITQRLSGFQRELNSLLGFFLAAQ
jgi:hypothetical protein